MHRENKKKINGNYYISFTIGIAPVKGICSGKMQFQMYTTNVTISITCFVGSYGENNVLQEVPLEFARMRGYAIKATRPQENCVSVL